MSLVSHIRRSFTAQTTLWVVGFAAIIMVVILLLMIRFIHFVGSSEGGGTMLMVMSILTAIVSIGVLSLLCWWVIGHHLHPLGMLADTAQRIADGNLEEQVPDTGQKDEIGQLQNSFAKMQRSLADYITELRQKRDTLNRQNAELQAAYEHAREADGVKSQFLSHMTIQMGQTVENIDELTKRLCDNHAKMSKTDMMKIQIQIFSYTDTVTHLLDQIISGCMHTTTEPLPTPRATSL